MSTAKTFRIILFTAATGALLLAVVAAIAVTAAPWIVARPSVQSALKGALSRGSGREIRWESLSLGRREGLVVTSLSVTGGKPPLQELTIGRISLVPRFGRDGGRFFVRIALHAVEPRVRLIPSPPPPPQPFREPLSLVAEQLHRFSTLSFPLPLEVGGVILVERGEVVRTDPSRPHPLVVSPLTLSLAAPDLRTGPLRLDLSARTGERPLRLTALVSGVVDGSGRIRPAGSVVHLSGAVFGGEMTLSGGVEAPGGIRGETRIDLPRLAEGFLPPSTPSPVTRGSLTLRLAAAATPSRDLSGSLNLSTSPLGLLVKQKEITLPPLSITLPFATDARRETVSFPRASLAIERLLSLGFDARVVRPARTDRTLELERGTLSADLRGIHRVAQGVVEEKFLPRAAEGTLRGDGIRLGRGAKGTGVSFGTLGITLGRFATPPGETSLEGRGLSLTLREGDLRLDPAGRVTASGRLLVTGDSVERTGKSPLSLRALRLETPLRATLGTGSSRSLPRHVTLSPRLALGEFSAGEGVSLRDARMSAEVDALLGDGGRLTLPTLSLDGGVGSLSVDGGGKRLQLPLSCRLSSPGVSRDPAHPLPLVPDLTARIETRGLSLSLGGRFDGPKRTLSLSAEADAAFSPLLATLSPLLPKGTAGEGKGHLTLSLTGRIPAPPSGSTPLFERVEALLSPLEKGNLSLSLADCSFTLPGKEGDLRVERLRTTTPVTLALAGGEAASLGGSLSAGEISTPRRKGDRSGTTGGTVSLSSRLERLERLTGEMTVRLPGQGVDGRLSLTAGRIRKLLEKSPRVDPAAILSHADLSGRLSLDASPPPGSLPLPTGLALSGSASLTAGVDLTGGKNLSVTFRITPRNFGFARADGLTVEGVDGEIFLSRSYPLSTGRPERGWVPLSDSMVAPPPTRMAGGRSERLAAELRGGGGERRIVVRKISIPRSPRPLTIAPLEADLTLDPHRAGIPRLSAELLGGTVRSTLMADLLPELPILSATLSCTGIETALLTTRREGERFESALAGDLSLRIPLRTTPREFLEGIRGELSLRSIGRDALERVLYSLDPEEKNEKVTAQRRLLRRGTLTRLGSEVVDGSLSLSGGVRVAGAEIPLPAVERVRLAELPLGKRLDPLMAGIGRLRTLFDLLRADAIAVVDGRPTLVRRNHGP